MLVLMSNEMSCLPPEDEMYAALISRDSEYEGIFFAGVTSTGIFCRPSCGAKKPKKNNVEFYSSVRAALMAGYRPCKICRPLEPLGEVPDWLKDLLKEVQSDPSARFRERELIDRGIDPARLRRWFKKHHNMTFQGYLRSLRINQAFGRIRRGSGVTQAAFESGYGSLSGFGEGFKKTMDFPPAQSQDHAVITVTRILSPMGPMFAAAVDEGICLLEFADRRMLETQFDRLQKYFRSQLLPGDHPHFDQLEEELGEYFRGERREFDIPLSIPGTDFQKQTWETLRTIPYGRTVSYGEQAKLMGNPRAVRAVARANGDNRIAIIIPCHRVIGSDGSLTGYGGGLWRKRKLLDLEQGGSPLA
jgi:AraC family transcriptional regulator of adaptative response/methylated-DNA-[protein]-cysteine methyltransferase